MTAARVLQVQDMDVGSWCQAVLQGLRTKQLAPYLGPGVGDVRVGSMVPTDYAALAAYFAFKVALPKRARGNPWASAQFVESQKHRSTVTALMRQAFAEPVAASAFQRALARAKLPLIIDTWYDASLRSALETSADWVEVQGITRAGIGEARWYCTYDAQGTLVPNERATSTTTVLYKPHGGVAPAGNFLITDADYVEVLTEIDIQSPIPTVVQARRAETGFVFLGCRFDDQLLRTYARQIAKRSRGPHYALFTDANLTRMEALFVHELGMHVAFAPLEEVLGRLTDI